MEREIEITEGVELKLEGNKVVVTGPKGVVEKKLAYPGINIQIQDKKVLINSKKRFKEQQETSRNLQSTH